MMNPNSDIPHWVLPKYYEKALKNHKEKDYAYIRSAAGSYVVYKIPIELIHYAFKKGKIKQWSNRNFFSIEIELRSLIKMRSKKIKRIAASLLLAGLTEMYIEYTGDLSNMRRAFFSYNATTIVSL